MQDNKKNNDSGLKVEIESPSLPTTSVKTQVSEIMVQSPIKHEEMKQPPFHTAQYITWVMLCFGWCIAVFLYKKNRNNTQSQRKIDRHNNYVKEFKDLLFEIESSSIAYWTSNEDDNDQVKLLKFQRQIKELTTKAQEIEKSGGIAYQTTLLKKLRKYVTLDNDQRPLMANSSRIDELREIVSELAKTYARKSDIG
jgi:hypothetical protein